MGAGQLDTSGYTLSQWQEILPSAKALFDDVDGDAINSLISAAGSHPIVLNLLGQAVINTTIISCRGNLYISGIGQGASITVATAGITAFRHCQSESPATDASFQLKNLRIICEGVACGDAMDVTLNNGAEPSLLLDQVSVTAFSGGNWANGAITTGIGGARIMNGVIALGSTGKISGTCLSITSSAPFTVLVQVEFEHFYWCGQAEQITSAASKQGVEGVYNVGVNADQVINFFNYKTTGSSYNPPEMLFYETEVSFFQSLFSVSNAAHTYESDWVIRDGWFIQLAPTTHSGSITSPNGLIDLGNAQRVTIDGNTFTQASGAMFNYLINVGGASRGWQIEHNYSPILLGKISQGIINIPSGATELVEKDNDWAYASNVVTNAAWATKSVASQAYISQQSGGACELIQLNRRGTLSNRAIQCQNTLMISPSGSRATITLPASIFQGSAQPVVLVSNATSGASVWPAGVEYPCTFAANAWSCTINTPSNSSAAARIYYTAIGF